MISWYVLAQGFHKNSVGRFCQIFRRFGDYIQPPSSVIMNYINYMSFIYHCTTAYPNMYLCIDSTQI